MSKSFKELLVWEKSMLLVEDIYTLCMSLPESEKYNMTSQIKRCVSSIPANIAEGHGKKSFKDFKNYLFISRGSSYELETFLILIERIYKIDTKQEQGKTVEIQKMISGLIKSL